MCSHIRPTFPGEWRLHPKTIRLLWSWFGVAQVNLVASHESSHGQLYDSLTEAPSAQTCWRTPGLGFYARLRFPQWAFSHRHCARSAKTRKPGIRNSCSSWQLLLAHPCEEGTPFSEARHHVAPASRSGNLHVQQTWVFCPPAVKDTFTQARALSTRRALALGLSLFTIGCFSHREDPRRCTIGVVTQAVTTNRKYLKLSFTEGRKPSRFLWGKEQRHGYL